MMSPKALELSLENLGVDYRKFIAMKASSREFAYALAS
jgi:hypothetical protein